jgi:hypothetical protein
MGLGGRPPTNHVSDACRPYGSARCICYSNHPENHCEQASGGKTALLVLHDNCTAGISLSHDMSTCAANLLFRLNGAAMVLSSR